MSKVCVKCGMEKPFSFFYKHITAKDGRRGECRACTLVIRKNQYGDPVFKAKRVRWQAKYNLSEGRKAKIEDYNLAKYGLTKVEYDEMVLKQGGTCKICKARHSPQTNRGRLYVDHCHITGKIRGLLCKYCNSLLGFAKDNECLLLEAVNYLKTA